MNLKWKLLLIALLLAQYQGQNSTEETKQEEETSQNDCLPLAIHQTPSFKDGKASIQVSWMTKVKCDQRLVLVTGDHEENYDLDNTYPITIKSSNYQYYEASFDFKKETFLNATFKYKVGGKTTYSDLYQIKPLSSNSELQVVVVSQIDKSQDMISSIVKLLEKQQHNTIIIDTTEFINDKDFIDYMEEIQALSGSVPYLFTSLPKDSKFKSASKLMHQITQEVSYIRSGTTNLFIIDAASLFNQQSIPQPISKQVSSKISEVSNKAQFNIAILTRPLYCSALNDQCTSQSTLVKSSYLDALTSSIKADLVISGNAQFYERTYPKQENSHLGQEDLSQFNKSEYPIFVNVNGGNLIAKDDRWALQKQSWSAQLRVKQVFGIVKMNLDKSLVFNAFDAQGNEIDEVTVFLLGPNENQGGWFFSIVLVLLLASVVPWAYVGLISSFSEFYQPYYKLLIEGKPIPVVQQSHNIQRSQHQRLRTNDSDEGANIEVEMSDLSLVGGTSQRGSFGSSGLTHRRQKKSSTQDSQNTNISTKEFDGDEESKEEIVNQKISKSKKKK